MQWAIFFLPLNIYMFSFKNKYRAEYGKAHYELISVTPEK